MKKAIISLWASSFSFLFVMIIIAQVKTFSELESGIVIFIFFSIILTAMLLQTLKNKNAVKSVSGVEEKVRERYRLIVFISKISIIIYAFIENIHMLILRL